MCEELSKEGVTQWKKIAETMERRERIHVFLLCNDLTKQAILRSALEDSTIIEKLLKIAKYFDSESSKVLYTVSE